MGQLHGQLAIGKKEGQLQRGLMSVEHPSSVPMMRKSDRPRSSYPRNPSCELEGTDSPSVHSGPSPRTCTEPGQCMSSTNVSVVQNPVDRDGTSSPETDSCAHAPPDYSLDGDKTWFSNPPHVRSLQTSESVYKTHTTSPRITDSTTDLKPAYLDACQDEDEALTNLLLQKETNLHTHAKGTNTYQGHTVIRTIDDPPPETPLLYHHTVSLQAADEAWLTTPLCLTVLTANVNLTHLLLQTGLIKVNSCCPTTRMTAMHLAVITLSPCSAEILSLLRAYGAVVDSQDADGNTPLHRAITAPSTSSHDPTTTTMPSSPTRYTAMIVKSLLRNNARIDIPNHRGELPLTLAAQTLNLAVFRLVLAASAVRLSDRRIVRVERYLRGRVGGRSRGDGDEEGTVRKMRGMVAAVVVGRCVLV